MGDDSGQNSTKKKLSNKLRLESIRQKRDYVNQQKKIISQALNAVDSFAGTATKKRCVFSDSDDSDSEDVKHSGKKTKLFDEDGEDEVQESGFPIRFQEESSGGKLMKLTPLSADPRFRMDSRFLEDEDEPSSAENAASESVLKEKEILLRVLKRVSEKPRRTVDEHRKLRQPAGVGFVRFDPTNAEHQKFEALARQDADDGPAESDSDRELEADQSFVDTDEKAKPLDSGRFYAVDRKFLNNLRNREKEQNGSQPFSLLSSLGREDPVKEVSVKSASSPEPKHIQKLKPWQKDILENRKVSADRDGQEESLQSTSRPLKTDSSALSFFFSSSDPRLADVVAKFKRTESIEVVRRSWSRYRESVVKSFKRQRREAQRRVEFKRRKMSVTSKK